jgi:hypothetical protein
MISSEVQRTLVKSPPELWAELSDPAALARHLGELGEIRIVKTNPEQSVEWEAEDAKGKVELQPSGWGTRVTLAITREMPDGLRADDQQPAEPQEQQADPPVEASTEPEPEVVPEPVVEIEPEIERKPRLGFFARLFRRRAKTAEPALVAAPEPEVAAAPGPEVAAVLAAGPACEIEPEPEPPSEDLAAELAAAEEAIVAESTELLSAVLDKLGSAHHRPFSRA